MHRVFIFLMHFWEDQPDLLDANNVLELNVCVVSEVFKKNVCMQIYLEVNYIHIYIVLKFCEWVKLRKTLVNLNDFKRNMYVGMSDKCVMVDIK